MKAATKIVLIALLCLIVFTIVLLVVDELVHSFDEGGATAIILFGLLSATACFFIIKKNPKSIWYVPLIINSLPILSAFTEQFFWTAARCFRYPYVDSILRWVDSDINFFNNSSNKREKGCRIS